MAAESALTSNPGREHAELWKREHQLLDRMQAIAERACHQPHAKTRRLIDWVHEEMCPTLPPFGGQLGGPTPRWSDRRVLIFTENREGTKRHLKAILEQAIEGSDGANVRSEVIDGLTRGARRKEIQWRFNADPAPDPLRILLATDAAREGLNFQAHRADVFHFDLPWNLGQHRAAQRPHRSQAAAGAGGALPRLRAAAACREPGAGGARLQGRDHQAGARQPRAARDRRGKLDAQVKRCCGLLERSRNWVGFEAVPFRQTLSCAFGVARRRAAGPECRWQRQREPQGDLDLSGARPANRGRPDMGGDPGHAPAAAQERPEAGRLAPRAADPAGGIRGRGVLSDDTVHLHLEQWVGQRLLASFRAQGFVYHNLSRACLAQAKDSIPRDILLGRLCLYGRRAERLHEEIVPLAARWIEPAQRTDP